MIKNSLDIAVKTIKMLISTINKYIMSKEIWKSIPGYEGYYEASTFGDIKSVNRYIKYFRGGYSLIKSKIKIPWREKHGYLRIKLSKEGKVNTYLVHRIIATTFLGLNLDETKRLTCHKNDIRDDNRLENLFLGTHSDNIQDCLRKGRFADMKGEKSGMSILTDDIVMAIKIMLNKYKTCKAIGDFWGVSEGAITNIKLNKTWKHITI